MKLLDELQITEIRHPLSISDGKMYKFNSTVIIKISSNLHKKGEAHVQCMNNYYSKFEYYGIKTFEGTDNTHTRNHLSISNEKNV